MHWEECDEDGVEWELVSPDDVGAGHGWWDVLLVEMPDNVSQEDDMDICLGDWVMA